MIEEKMERMILSMNALTEALNNIASAANASVKQAPESESKPTPKPEPESVVAVKPAPERPITINDLQDVCLAMVRKNKNLKPKIGEVIKSFGGTLLKDISKDKYPAIMEALKSLEVDNGS
jgi:hypothetical protein